MAEIASASGLPEGKTGEQAVRGVPRSGKMQLTMKQTLERFALEAGVRIDILNETDSTNDLASDPRYGPGDVVIAERQRAGRGQRGNVWNSTPGENLTFSVVLRPDFLEAERQFYISKVIALAVADTIVTLGLTPAIKWPNDIYIGDRKVCGILIENDLMGAFLCRSIAGIGLNVNQREFDPSLPNPTSLAREAGRTFDRAEVFTTFYRSLAHRYRMLAGEPAADNLPEEEQGRTKSGRGSTGDTSECDRLGDNRHGETSECDRFGDNRHGGAARIDTDYMNRLYRLGEEHLYLDGRTQERFRGTITGIRPGGELEVRHSADGHTALYLFKEIEYLIGETFATKQAAPEQTLPEKL